MVREMTPVLLVTGSLGVGKTTLLNHLLGAHHGKRIAVLVNDFGPINIDAALLAYQGNVNTDHIIEFSNGCICCNINGDVQKALHTLEERRERLDVVVVETSGVCDVGPIVDTLRRAVGELWRLDGVLCVVDASQFDATSAVKSTSSAAGVSTDFASGDENQEQIVGADVSALGAVEQKKQDRGAFSSSDVADEQARTVQQMSQADCIIVNKMDCCRSRENVLTQIKRQCPSVPILPAEHGKVDVDILAMRHDITRPVTEPSSKHGAMTLHTWLYEQNDRPFCPLSFEDIVWPSSIVRAKGFVWLDGCPQVVVFHLCGRRSNPFETLAAMGTPSKSTIVFMQTKNEETQVRALLDAALVPQKKN